jgi:hypothetical protein
MQLPGPSGIWVSMSSNILRNSALLLATVMVKWLILVFFMDSVLSVNVLGNEEMD